jgi:antitoxin ParD1/3/4
MPTQNVNLSDRQSKFIRQSVDGGRYRNASEVVRAGLRALEQSEREDKLKLQTLRRLAKQAFDEIDRGEFVEVDPDDIEEFVAKIAAEARKSKA